MKSLKFVLEKEPYHNKYVVLEYNCEIGHVLQDKKEKTCSFHGTIKTSTLKQVLAFMIKQEAK